MTARNKRHLIKHTHTHTRPQGLSYNVATPP
jgi:hypothetical protein